MQHLINIRRVSFKEARAAASSASLSASLWARAAFVGSATPGWGQGSPELFLRVESINSLVYPFSVESRYYVHEVHL